MYYIDSLTIFIDRTPPKFSVEYMTKCIGKPPLPFANMGPSDEFCGVAFAENI